MGKRNLSEAQREANQIRERERKKNLSKAQKEVCREQLTDSKKEEVVPVLNWQLATPSFWCSSC
jgi:hypothetical protein